MHDEVTECLRAIFPGVLEFARGHGAPMPWKRYREGRGEEKPATRRVSGGGSLHPDNLAQILADAIREHHPKYLGPISLLSMECLAHEDAGWLLDGLVLAIWQKHGTFDVGEEGTEWAIIRLAEFLDRETVRICYLAPIVNLRVVPGESRIPLPGDVTIRALSEGELKWVTDDRLGYYLGRMPKYTFAGEFDEPMRFGEGTGSADPSPARKRVNESLERAVVALRSFKSAPVGYIAVHMAPVDFCPIVPLVTLSDLRDYVPLGFYTLDGDEVDQFTQYARRVCELDRRKHEALYLAISRLADAAVRRNPRDKLLDAVIGLEALLIPGGEQEKTYRFALNWALLSEPGTGRLSEFEEAKRVYRCRSKVGHGGSVADGEVTEKAEVACRKLRKVVQLCLGEGGSPKHRDKHYWEKRFLGVSEWVGGVLATHVHPMDCRAGTAFARSCRLGPATVGTRNRRRDARPGVRGSRARECCRTSGSGLCLRTSRGRSMLVAYRTTR